MKRAPLYSGPRRNRTGAGSAQLAPTEQVASQRGASPSAAAGLPGRGRSPASTDRAWPDRAPAGRFRDERAAVWGGPPKRYPGQANRRWPEPAGRDATIEAAEGVTAGRGRPQGQHHGQGADADAGDTGPSPGPRRSRLARAAWPVAGVLAGVVATLGYLLLAPAGWPGSTADRGATLTQEQIDEAVGQSLKTLVLPSMAARAAAVVAPSVVRVRSFGPAEAPSATEGGERSAPAAPREGAPGQPPGGQAGPPAGQGNPPAGQGSPPSGQGNPPMGQGNPPSGQGNPGLPGSQSAQAPQGNPPDGQASPQRPGQRDGGEPRLDKGERVDRAEQPPERAGRGDRGGPDGKGTAREADVQNGVGTGVVIKDDGLILSNLHVVAGARRITVVFADGTESPATLTGARPEHDLAVLKASKVPDDLQPAVLRSTGDLSEGDGIVVVGFPFDIGPSVSAGVISGFNREYQSASGARVLSNLIQFDAAANPGNSGGPLVTMEGEVVGIVTAILNPNNQRSFVGIGFAVPIENAMAAAGLPPH